MAVAEADPSGDAPMDQTRRQRRARRKAGVAQAGFELARTTEQGYVRQGADKLALPCIRINAGTAMSEFIAAVG